MLEREVRHFFYAFTPTLSSDKCLCSAPFHFLSKHRGKPRLPLTLQHRQARVLIFKTACLWLSTTAGSRDRLISANINRAEEVRNPGCWSTPESLWCELLTSSSIFTCCHFRFWCNYSLSGQSAPSTASTKQTTPSRPGLLVLTAMNRTPAAWNRLWEVEDKDACMRTNKHNECVCFYSEQLGK